MGSQDFGNCYNVIEAVAERSWCNGNVGMDGNSALAIIQWLVASLQPPHLAAIAPWAGSGDIYREHFCRGGWFQMSNFDLITREIFKGSAGIEDSNEMHSAGSSVSIDIWAMGNDYDIGESISVQKSEDSFPVSPSLRRGLRLDQRKGRIRERTGFTLARITPVVSSCRLFHSRESALG